MSRSKVGHGVRIVRYRDQFRDEVVGLVRAHLSGSKDDGAVDDVGQELVAVEHFVAER
jgi:hypothetical protein